MRQVTINLTDEVHAVLETRAAIDDLKIEIGLEMLLTEWALMLNARMETLKVIEREKLTLAGKEKRNKAQGIVRDTRLRHAGDI